MDKALHDAEFDVAFQYALILLKTPLSGSHHDGQYRSILGEIGREVKS